MLSPTTQDLNNTCGAGRQEAQGCRGRQAHKNGPQGPYRLPSCSRGRSASPATHLGSQESCQNLPWVSGSFQAPHCPPGMLSWSCSVWTCCWASMGVSHLSQPCWLTRFWCSSHCLVLCAARSLCPLHHPVCISASAWSCLGDIEPIQSSCQQICNSQPVLAGMPQGHAWH